MQWFSNIFLAQRTSEICLKNSIRGNSMGETITKNARYTRQTQLVDRLLLSRTFGVPSYLSIERLSG